MTMDINEAMGERYSSGFAPVLPKSVYPGKITVLSTGTTDVKEDGGGGTPFAELHLAITEGPFAGQEVTRKVYLTPGKKGGYLGLFAGWCKALTGTSANAAAMGAAGIKVPPQGDMSPQEYRTVVRDAVKDAYFAMSPDARLKFVSAYVRVDQWTGKSGIVGLGVETSTRTDADGVEHTYTNNVFESIFPMSDPQKGLAYYRNAVKAVQDEAFATMRAEGLL